MNYSLLLRNAGTPAGLASMPATIAANIGAEYVDTNETLDILKADD